MFINKSNIKSTHIVLQALSKSNSSISGASLPYINYAKYQTNERPSQKKIIKHLNKSSHLISRVFTDQITRTSSPTKGKSVIISPPFKHLIVYHKNLSINKRQNKEYKENNTCRSNIYMPAVLRQSNSPTRNHWNSPRKIVLNRKKSISYISPNKCVMNRNRSFHTKRESIYEKLNLAKDENIRLLPILKIRQPLSLCTILPIYIETIKLKL
jgi:hypothetical protein